MFQEGNFLCENDLMKKLFRIVHRYLECPEGWFFIKCIYPDHFHVIFGYARTKSFLRHCSQSIGGNARVITVHFEAVGEQHILDISRKIRNALLLPVTSLKKIKYIRMIN